MVHLARSSVEKPMPNDVPTDDTGASAPRDDAGMEQVPPEAQLEKPTKRRRLGALIRKELVS